MSPERRSTETIQPGTTLTSRTTTTGPWRTRTTVPAPATGITVGCTGGGSVTTGGGAVEGGVVVVVVGASVVVVVVVGGSVVVVVGSLTSVAVAVPSLGPWPRCSVVRAPDAASAPASQVALRALRAISIVGLPSAVIGVPGPRSRRRRPTHVVARDSRLSARNLPIPEFMGFSCLS